jgi:hypothetical protein
VCCPAFCGGWAIFSASCLTNFCCLFVVKSLFISLFTLIVPRRDILFPVRQLLGTMDPQGTPPKDGQQYESNPALVALALSEHSGFDAVGDSSIRVMTPPPQYSRVEPSRCEPPRRLTLMIPETTQDIGVSSSSPASPNTQASPVIALSQSTGTSPVETSPSRENEAKFFTKVKAGMRKRKEGISKRLRRTSSGSKSSSASSSPCDMAVSPSWSLNGPIDEMVELIPQELDSHEIDMPATRDQHPHPEVSPQQYRSSHHEWQSVMAGQRPQRQSSFSSIVPTPRRGLSLAGPAPRHPLNNDFNANELASQLVSLTEDDSQSVQDSLVSPYSPTSPGGAWPVHTLMRSGAITDRVSSMDHPILPLTAHSRSPRSPSPPPATPTLDGRLDRLPRIETPSLFQNNNQLRNRLDTLGSLQPSLQAVQRMSEMDSGKELVVQGDNSGDNSGRLRQPFSTPCWRESQAHNATAVPRIVVDHAANAPEFAASVPNSPVVMEPLDTLNQYPPQRLYTARPLKRPSPFTALTGTALEGALSGLLKATELLRYYYGPEPPIPEKHVRVRWNCVSACSHLTNWTAASNANRLAEKIYTMITSRIGQAQRLNSKLI